MAALQRRVMSGQNKQTQSDLFGGDICSQCRQLLHYVCCLTILADWLQSHVKQAAKQAAWSLVIHGLLYNMISFKAHLCISGSKVYFLYNETRGVCLQLGAFFTALSVNVVYLSGSVCLVIKILLYFKLFI